MSIQTVDAAAAAVTYNAFRKDGDSVTYIGPAHSDLSKDMLVVKSVSPKQTSISYGNRRSSCNYLVTVTSGNPDGTSTAKDMKAEIVVSLPAGVSFASLKEALRRLGGILTTDAIATDLFHIGKIDR
nr:MAG: hypothetical protein 2 [Leviviridae sp.]